MEKLTELLLQAVWLLPAFALVYALTRGLGFQPAPPHFANARRSALLALAAIAVGGVLFSILLLIAGGRGQHASIEPGIRHFGPATVFNRAILAAIVFGPALVVMRWQREPPASAMISRRDLWRAIAAGLLLGVLSLAWRIYYGQQTTQTVGQFWGFLDYSVVGWSEEFGYRGYLQTRMIAWLGRWEGWLVSSVLMAMSHAPLRIAVHEASLADGLFQSASLIPISLLLGYVMLRTGNVTAPALFHTFADWAGTVG